MNWGYKILVVIVVFILSILSMVFVAFRQDNEMFEENYYEKEMKYQTLIDASENLNKLTDTVLLIQAEHSIILDIPSFQSMEFQNGKMEFLRINEKSLDRSFEIQPNESGHFEISKSELKPGMYKARVKWKGKEKDYYREQNILIN